MNSRVTLMMWKTRWAFVVHRAGRPRSPKTLVMLPEGEDAEVEAAEAAEEEEEAAEEEAHPALAQR